MVARPIHFPPRIPLRPGPQTEALEAFKAGRNIVLIGLPRTGKTHVLKALYFEGVRQGRHCGALSHTNSAANVTTGRLEDYGLGTTLHKAGKMARLEDLGRMTYSLDQMLEPAPKTHWEVGFLDEFQDTSFRQFALYESLVEQKIVSGDFGQAICNWPGNNCITPGFLETYIERTNSVVLTLKENWESARKLVEMANSYMRVETVPVRLEEGVIQWVVGWPDSLEDLALLLRTNKEVRRLSAEFERRGIPHTIIDRDERRGTEPRQKRVFSGKEWGKELRGREVRWEPKESPTGIMTVHSAKGSSFRRVFFHLPTNTHGYESLERCIVNVAITRATDELYLCSPVSNTLTRGLRP